MSNIVISLIRVPRVGKFTKTQRRIEVSILMGTVSFAADENFLEIDTNNGYTIV